MASPLEPLPKRLSELLQEEQEPFLIGNGYSKTLSKATCKCWMFKSNRFRRRKAGGLRQILTKLAYWESIKKSLNWERFRLVDCFSEIRGNTGFYRLSSSSFRGGEINGGETNGWKNVELSPVSVLELHSDDNHSLDEENPPSSASVQFSPVPHNGETKRELHQSSHLLLDYLEEMEERGWESYAFGVQKVGGNLIGEEFFQFEKQIELDLSETSRACSHFDAERRDVGREIEGIIFEEMREECVFDVLGFHCTLDT